MKKDSFSYFFLLNFLIVIFIILYFIHKYDYLLNDTKIVYNKMAYSSN
jgi:hypothetical protein